MSHGNDLSVARPYPYTKLEGKTRIRLLKLYPETHESSSRKIFGRELDETHLYGTLIEVDLATQPSYECLSYCWGRSKRTKMLCMDERMIPITANLSSALHCLQYEDRPRLLWVDFVCINQEDPHECNSQVQLMYDIFSSAQKVVAYLGVEADGSERILDILEKICLASERIRTNPDLQKLHGTDSALEPYGLPSGEDAFWEALRKFLSRDWFFRVWILQEVVAARSLDIMCGSWTTLGDFFFTALILSLSHRFPVTNFSLDQNFPWEQPNIRGCNQVLLMHELGICGWIAPELEQRTKEWALVEMLERSRYAAASDPRDRVFALLNLCKEGKSGEFRPDYTETACETFTRTAEFLINSGHGEKVLLNAFLSDPSLNLPSWVPDWSFSSFPSENPVPPFTTYDRQSTSTGRTQAPCIRLDTSRSCLSIKAYRIGEIASLGCVYKYRYTSPFYVGLIDEAMQYMNENEPDDYAQPEVSSSGAVVGGSQWVQSLDPEATSESRPDWPPLLFIIREVLSSLRTSSRYSEQDYDDIVWRTMVCSYHFESIEQSRQDYSGPYKAFLDITRCQFEREYLARKILEIFVTCIGSNKPPPKGTSPEDDPVFHSFVQKLGELNLRAERFHSEARRFCFHMRVAKTDSGYIGMVAQQAQAGDIIVIIKGVPVPMIVRRSEAEEECFKLVGQAYFYGLLERQELTKDENLTEETITLV